MAKRPSFQFYPGDWLRSTDLRSCSIGARGLWIEMLCLMHEGQPYGFLKVKDKVIKNESLARMVGATLEEIEGWLHELEDAGVFSRDSQNCIFSRRMLKDEEIRQKRGAGGVLGGNPKFKKQKNNHEDNLNDNHDPNLVININDENKTTFDITPSSSSASASAINNRNISNTVELSDPNGEQNFQKKIDEEKIFDNTKFQPYASLLYELGYMPHELTQHENTIFTFKAWFDANVAVDIARVTISAHVAKKGGARPSPRYFLERVLEAQKKFNETGKIAEEIKNAPATTNGKKDERSDIVTADNYYEKVLGIKNNDDPEQQS